MIPYETLQEMVINLQIENRLLLEDNDNLKKSKNQMEESADKLQKENNKIKTKHKRATEYIKFLQEKHSNLLSEYRILQREAIEDAKESINLRKKRERTLRLALYWRAKAKKTSKNNSHKIPDGWTVFFKGDKYGYIK